MPWLGGTENIFEKYEGPFPHPFKDNWKDAFAKAQICQA